MSLVLWERPPMINLSEGNECLFREQQKYQLLINVNCHNLYLIVSVMCSVYTNLSCALVWLTITLYTRPKLKLAMYPSYTQAKPINIPVSHHPKTKFQCGRALQKKKQLDHVTKHVVDFISTIQRLIRCMSTFRSCKAA